MSWWHRALLVVSALPLVEVSCGGYGGKTRLHLVAEGESFRSPLTGAAAVVEAAAAGVIGLASGRFFGLDGLGCAIASCDSAAADAHDVGISDAAPDWLYGPRLSVRSHRRVALKFIHFMVQYLRATMNHKVDALLIHFAPDSRRESVPLLRDYFDRGTPKTRSAYYFNRNYFSETAARPDPRCRC